jgi:hypothetical protein
MAMAYSSLLGKRVEAHYRASDLHLSAVGTLVSDSGNSIVLEERFLQDGKEKTVRVEIPYEYVIRVVEAAENSPASPPSQGASPK